MLKINHLTIEFHDRDPITTAVSDFSLEMKPGEIVGIVGESGSGKTMTALAIMGLLNRYASIPQGEIYFKNQNLLDMDEEGLRQIRGGKIGMVFQEPMTSLNPLKTIGLQIEEPLRLHKKVSDEEAKREALQIMQAVELPNPEELYKKYPHELSGGMRQRVMIASALICKPDLLIADEPTTALDVTTQSQIIHLLKWINEKQGTGILFISHNLAVVEKLCQRIFVMHNGLTVESGTIQQVFEHPSEEYTKKLMDAIPTRKDSMRRRMKRENHTSV